MELNNKETNVLSRIQERIIAVEGGDVEARIAEALLDEPTETPEEIAELETIPDEKDLSDTKNSEMEFAINSGPMKNLHINHLNANTGREVHN